VSVVIPTRNRTPALVDALASIRCGELQGFEVLIMDQSDGDETRDAVSSFNDRRFKYHRMPRPGACPARNLGAAIARAPIVAFLDDDCCPRPDWLRRIVDSFEADERLMFIFGRLSAPEHDDTEGTFPVFQPNASLLQPRNHRRLMTSAAGANMSCRKSFLLEHGGFDELLGAGMPRVMGNDTSIVFKVLRSGVRWHASPEIDVTHTHGFRTYAQWGHLLVNYAHGGGVNYGRFLRRGDLRAVWYALLESKDMLKEPVRSALRLRRPHGLGVWLGFARGLGQGLLLSGRDGYFDGARMRALEASGQLLD
jgi:glycosyltransferase involved in cell wall biosynthesis